MRPHQHQPILRGNRDSRLAAAALLGVVTLYALPTQTLTRHVVDNSVSVLVGSVTPSLDFSAPSASLDVASPRPSGVLLVVLAAAFVVILVHVRRMHVCRVDRIGGLHGP